MALKRWKKLSEQTINTNPYWTYKLDKFEIEGTLEGEYHYVNSPGSTLVIPITKEKEILLVRQYRYLIKEFSLEFPCGAIEDNMLPDKNAQKELREETGYKANHLEKVGAFVPYNGVSDEICHVFIASDLEYAPLKGDKTEEIELVKLPIPELEHALLDGKIADGMSLSGYLLAKSKLEKPDS